MREDIYIRDAKKSKQRREKVGIKKTLSLLVVRSTRRHHRVEKHTHIHSILDYHEHYWTKLETKQTTKTFSS